MQVNSAEPMAAVTLLSPNSRNWCPVDAATTSFRFATTVSRIASVYQMAERERRLPSICTRYTSITAIDKPVQTQITRRLSSKGSSAHTSTMASALRRCKRRARPARIAARSSSNRRLNRLTAIT